MVSQHGVCPVGMTYYGCADHLQINVI
jgi:hypothetical protein